MTCSLQHFHTIEEDSDIILRVNNYFLLFHFYGCHILDRMKTDNRKAQGKACF